jgi:hypothetical protein
MVGRQPIRVSIPERPGGYFACPDSAGSAERDSRAASEPPGAARPGHRPPRGPGSRTQRECLAPAGTGGYGRFMEISLNWGNFPRMCVQVPPRTQIHAHFPRFGIRLNTRPCDLPLRGDFTGLRGQAALQVPGGAGNPPVSLSPASAPLVAAPPAATSPPMPGRAAQYAGDLRSNSRRHQLDPLPEMLGE